MVLARYGRNGVVNTKVLQSSYTPRAWQQEVHTATAAHRFICVVAHRRSGKTVLAVNLLIAVAMAKEGARLAYIAPTIRQAKSISWSLFKEFTQGIPNVNFRESDNRIVFPNNSELLIFAGDSADAIRGHGLDGVVLDEAGSYPSDAWPSAIRPTLSDKGGFAVFIGTPAGVGDQFHQAYLRGQDDLQTEWWSKLYPVTDTGALSDPEVASARASAISQASFEREYMASFSASTDDVPIPIPLVTAAMKRTMSAAAQGSLQGAARVIGCDVARFGGDRTVFAARHGHTMLPLKVYGPQDLMHTVGLLTQLADRFTPDAIFVDVGGMGAGVVDRCQQLGYDVIGVDFGSKAVDQRYGNRRCEMYASLKRWLEDGGILPDDQRLLSDLSSARFEFDSANRMRLESKDKIRKRLGTSPDMADALALTLAMPVQARSLVDDMPHHLRSRSALQTVSEFDPFDY